MVAAQKDLFIEVYTLQSSTLSGGVLVDQVPSFLGKVRVMCNTFRLNEGLETDFSYISFLEMLLFPGGSAFAVEVKSENSRDFS